MKILSIQVLASPKSPGQTAVVLASASDVSSFSFFQRQSIGEFLTFMSKTVAERTTPGQRQSVQENTHTAHCYSRVAPGSLSGVIITDEDYPARPAFTLLNKLLDDFIARVPRDKWQAATDAALSSSKPRADGIDFPQVNDYLVKYQDPRQADAIMKVQQELDETKIVLHKTIESVLERGEKLDSLVEKSNALSTQCVLPKLELWAQQLHGSKMFYKSAKKTNSCCTIS